MKYCCKYKETFPSGNLLYKYLKVKGCKVKMNFETELDTKTDIQNYLKNNFSFLEDI